MYNQHADGSPAIFAVDDEDQMMPEEGFKKKKKKKKYRRMGVMWSNDEIEDDPNEHSIWGNVGAFKPKRNYEVPVSPR